MPRLIGFALLLGGLLLLAYSLFCLVTSGSFEPIKLGAAWNSFNASSLQMLQSGVERLSPPVWQSFIAPILNFWLWAVMLVIGLLLMAPAMLRDR